MNLALAGLLVPRQLVKELLHEPEGGREGRVQPSAHVQAQGWAMPVPLHLPQGKLRQCLDATHLPIVPELEGKQVLVRTGETKQ